jgi:hypothetical protein
MPFDLARYFRETFGASVVALRSNADEATYESAVDAFARTGNRKALFADLLALGIPADLIRWHADNPGETMQVAIGSAS